MDRYALIRGLGKKPLGPKPPKLTYVKTPRYFMGIYLDKVRKASASVVVCHLGYRQIVPGDPDRFIFYIDYKNIFINEIVSKIKNMQIPFMEMGVLKTRINNNGAFPVGISYDDFIRISDIWRERVERGMKSYGIVPYRVNEEYKEAYEIALSRVIDSIDETGFYEIGRP